MKFIFSGGGQNPNLGREQWTDGCNLVALRPGVRITYDGNHKTREAFKNMGFELKGAQEIIANIKNGCIKVDGIQNTIRTHPSGELSRARGGSHPMTCPISRKNI